MEQARWDRIAALFLDAVAQTPEQRAALFDDACVNDAELRAEVSAMLSAHAAEHGSAIEQRLMAHGDSVGATLAPGTLVGAYRIDALVGEGGMGEVYRAERVDGGFAQTVALKVLRPGYATAETVRRFRLERQVLARLVHPGIAAIHDSGTLADGRPYLVLQFVDGLPITAHCEQRALGVAPRVRLFSRVANAVQAAHAHLVVHRDIKPSNVLVDNAGLPWLLDFGIAKTLDGWDDGSLAGATRPEVRMLTPGNAAPEQLRGEPVTVATDVYGLGVLLYELLTGRRPFLSAGLTPAQFEQVVLHDAPPAPSSVVARALSAELAGDLDHIVLMALRKEPERRYATAAEFADDLHRYLDGQPVRAQPDTLQYRAKKFSTRNRGAVAAAVTATIALMAFATTATVQARRIAVERDRAESERAAAEDVVGVLTGLFERANPAVVPGGDTLRVTALLADGERRVDELAAHPERQARLWRVLGQMHSARGEYVRAQSLLQRAWDAQRMQRGGDDPEAARTYHQLALVRSSYTGGDATARLMLDTSLSRLRRVLGENHRDVIAALQDRAAAATSLAEQRGFLGQAETLQRQRSSQQVQPQLLSRTSQQDPSQQQLASVPPQPRQGQAPLPPPPPLPAQPDSNAMSAAALLNNQAAVNLASGALSDARLAFEGTLRILREQVPDGHPARITVTRNLASVLSSLGEWTNAESLVRECIAHDTRVHADSVSAVDLETLGLLAAHQGRLSEGEARLRAALSRFRARLDADHWRIDNTLRNLGLVIVARGRVAEGLTILDSAIARARARPDGTASRGYGYMVGQRVRPLLRLGRAAEAVAAMEQSERIVRRVATDDDAYLADVAQWRGELSLSQGDYSGAEHAFRDALRRTTTRLPQQHPKRAGIICMLGVSQNRQRADSPVSDSVRASCATYSRWGLADSMMLAWSRMSTSSEQRRQQKENEQ
jgi:eukaryotic-like serine/threonine-protein kinase